MKAYLLLLCLIFCVAISFVSAQQFQLMGPKAAFGLNSFGNTEGGYPFGEFAALGYVKLGNRLGAMPEVGLRSLVFQSQRGGNAGARITSHVLYGKVNFIYALTHQEAGKLPRLFVSAGFSYGRVLIVDENPRIPENPFVGWIFRTGIFRPVRDVYVGIGFLTQISSRARLLIHPEYSPDPQVSALGPNPSMPWEIKLNASVLWELK